MVEGSHHSPESSIIYKTNIEKTCNKKIAVSEDRTPTIAEKGLPDNRYDRSAKPDFYL